MKAQLEVIVAAYNAQAYLEETLESLLSQGPWVQIRIVDDCSTDATAEIAQRYVSSGRVVYQCLATNSGRSSTPRNAGLSQVTAPYVAFFDADDVMASGALGRALSALAAHPHCVAITGDYRNFSKDGEGASTHFETCPQLQRYWQARGKTASALPVPGRMARRLLAMENFAITGAAVYRTATLKQLGGFDADLRNSEDFALIWRMCELGDLLISPDVVFRRRLHPASKSSNTARILNGKVLCREKLLRGETDSELRCLLARSLTRFLSAQAAYLMPTDLKGGLRALLRALGYGLASGTVPQEGAKALIKRLIGYCPQRA